MSAIHIQQAHPNTCIAACVSMWTHRSGRLCDELALISTWGPPPPQGYPLSKLDALPGITAQTLDLRHAVSLDTLLVWLERGWVFSEVFVGPWAVFAREYTPPLCSPHGPITTLYTERDSLMSFGQSRHLVLLTSYEPGGSFLVLDPYHSRDHQPLRVGEDWLFHASTCRFWVTT